ncbi:MAG: hypothetical protein J0H64_03810 [Actinobacteria bacterium]|nr:hypothetical protein [Actinomycetota bacterium]
MDYNSSQINEAFAGIFSGAGSVVLIAYYVLLVVAAWKMFSKAGYPGILALIPIVNLIVIVKIAGYSGWLVLLYLIPIVNVVFAILVALRLGGNFGKGGFFSILWLWLFPVIGYFVIGYGSARYQRA